jgi:translation initiation factor IF-3
MFARCSSLLSRANVLRSVAHPALATIQSQHAAPIFTVSRASRGVPLCSAAALLPGALWTSGARGMAGRPSHARKKQHAFVPKQHPINEAIGVGPSGTTRLVSNDGQQLGVMTLAEALATAQEAKLDLVLVQNTTDPIVCKLKDYFKEKYVQKRRQKEAAKLKATSRVLATKEVKFRAVISDHDLQTKLRKARQFLMKGHRVQITMLRPKKHMLDRGDGLLADIVGALSDCGEVKSQKKTAVGGYEAQFDPLSLEARELLMRAMEQQQQQEEEGEGEYEDEEEEEYDDEEEEEQW